MAKTIAKPLTEMEKAYLCKFYPIDGPDMVADALERNKRSLQTAHNNLKRRGRAQYYIDMWDRQFKEVEGNGWF